MMYDPYAPRISKSNRGRANLASCAVAAVFLLILGAAAVAVYFFLFKPKPPQIAVDAVQFPAFSVSNGTLDFTLFQFVTVTNPNRDEFSHYDSSLQLVYYGQPLGLVFIPAGKIQGGRAQHMSAKFDVHSYRLPVPVGASPSTMEIETKMALEGRVRVLRVFTHRVQSGVRCGVVVELSRGSVLGFHC